MVRARIGMRMGWLVVGCGAGPAPLVPAPTDGVAKPQAVAGDPSGKPVDPAATDRPPTTGPWIGAAGASDFVLPGVNDTVLGVWIDVPAGPQKARAHASVALVIDTSGSMAGAKMDNARRAARSLVEKLGDGDIVSIHP